MEKPNKSSKNGSAIEKVTQPQKLDKEGEIDEQSHIARG